MVRTNWPMENMIDTQNKQQVMAFELIANTNSSFFLTGRAGTGKTTFLRNVRWWTNSSSRWHRRA